MMLLSSLLSPCTLAVALAPTCTHSGSYRRGVSALEDALDYRDMRNGRAQSCDCRGARRTEKRGPQIFLGGANRSGPFNFRGSIALSPFAFRGMLRGRGLQKRCFSKDLRHFSSPTPTLFAHITCASLSHRTPRQRVGGRSLPKMCLEISIQEFPF